MDPRCVLPGRQDRLPARASSTSAFRPASTCSMARTRRRPGRCSARRASTCSDRFELQVGARYSDHKTTNHINVNQYGLPLTQDQSASFSDTSGKVALNFEVNDHHFLYAFVATGFRPGGLNVPVGLGPPAPFIEEEVTNYEIGWKSGWADGRLRTQFDVFYNDYENFQVIVGYPRYPGVRLRAQQSQPHHDLRLRGATRGGVRRILDGCRPRLAEERARPVLRRGSARAELRRLRPGDRAGKRVVLQSRRARADLRTGTHVQHRHAVRLRPGQRKRVHAAHQLRPRRRAVGDAVPGRGAGRSCRGARHRERAVFLEAWRAGCPRCTARISPISTTWAPSTPACASRVRRASSDCGC